jgi:hypothetical protein
VFEIVDSSLYIFLLIMSTNSSRFMFLFLNLFTSLCFYFISLIWFENKNVYKEIFNFDILNLCLLLLLGLNFVKYKTNSHF